MKTPFYFRNPSALLAAVVFICAGSSARAQSPGRVAITARPPIISPSPAEVGLEAQLTTISRGAGQKGKVFVSRSGGNTLADLTVNYILTGTAVNGEDYSLLADSVVIPAGEGSAKIKILPLAGGKDSKVKVVVQPGDGYTVNEATKKVAIQIVD